MVAACESSMGTVLKTRQVLMVCQIGAMIISSATGLVLDRSVNRYKGFALLAVSITGMAGSIGAIQ